MSSGVRRARPATGRNDLLGRRSAERAAHERVLEAVRLMRERGYSLTRASREAGTTPGTVLHHVGRQGVRRDGVGQVPSDQV